MVNLHETARTDATDCGEFMARHSDYMDGLLPTLAAARLQAHVQACASCARYDRVVRKGVDLVRDLPAIEPASDFEQRLQHRLYHLEDARALARQPGGATATLVVGALIAMLAWSPVLLRDGASVPTGAALVQADDVVTGDHMPVAEGALPALLDASNWYPLPLSEAHTTLLAAFPGPYSPLIVTPPAHRAVRIVSSEYRPVE